MPIFVVTPHVGICISLVMKMLESGNMSVKYPNVSTPLTRATAWERDAGVSLVRPRLIMTHIRQFAVQAVLGCTTCWNVIRVAVGG